MAMTAAIVALVLSTLLLGTVITLLVMLRRGDGPVYSASRAYDTNRREALRLLLGDEVEAPPREQWFVTAPHEPISHTALENEFREAATEALRLAVPADRKLAIDPNGRITVAGARVVPALSTADLRDPAVLETCDDGGLLVGLVLVNPEPLGGDARRLALPVQVLFPALERMGREDLIHRFSELRRRVAETIAMEVSS